MQQIKTGCCFRLAACGCCSSLYCVVLGKAFSIGRQTPAAAGWLQVSGQRLTLVELLGQFQSLSVSLDQLANLLPRMGPR